MLDDKSLVGKPRLLKQRTDLQVPEELLQPTLIRALRELRGKKNRWGLAIRLQSTSSQSVNIKIMYTVQIVEACSKIKLLKYKFNWPCS